MTAYPTAEQRAHPMYCTRQARRTPMIPFHNGQYTYRIGPYADGSIATVRQPCLACGKVAA